MDITVAISGGTDSLFALLSLKEAGHRVTALHARFLHALESGDPVRDFDILGITLGFEMCYTTSLQMLKMAGIPLRAADRSEQDPIVIGGGACAYNPEPLADFFDCFSIGEGEDNLV